MNVLIVQDQKANGTSSGTSIAGIQTRDLNTVLTNTIAGASLAANQFTLPVGDYLIIARAPGNTVGQHQAMLNNVTTSTIYHGSNARAGSPSATDSIVSVAVTTAGDEVFQIDHYTHTGGINTGLGMQSGTTGPEIYTTVTVQQL